MLRETNVQRLHWADKTMSVLRQQQLEACERRLMALPGFGLFDLEDDLRVEEIWRCSFDAQEHPRLTHLHTVKELRMQVLSTLPAEAALLSMEEHVLLDRLITLGGEAMLMDWEETSAAESLVRRMWCTMVRTGDHLAIRLPDELLTPLTMVLSSHQHEEIRSRLMHHDAIIRALLYLGGLLHYAEALQHLMSDVLDKTYAADERLAMRYLRVSYDYMIAPGGDMLLLHPGLAEPDRLLSLPAPSFRSGKSMDLDEETMCGAIEGLMPEERPLFDRLYGLLTGATRPEITEEEAVEDLRMLAKQGVSSAEMQEVLSSLLTIQPTWEMRQAVEQLHQLTPRWGRMSTAALQ